MKTLALLLCCAISSFAGLSIRERLQYAVDSGEQFVSAGQVRKLHRLPGAVFIRADSIYSKDELVQTLIALGGPFEGWVYQPTGWVLNFYLRAPLETVQAQNLNPTLLQEKLDLLRETQHVALANPVHIDPETGYELVVLDEINISLHAQALPSAVFGRDLEAVHPLFPESFEHVLSRTGRTAKKFSLKPTFGAGFPAFAGQSRTLFWRHGNALCRRRTTHYS